MSSKWPGRAPDGRVLLRGFVGGPRDQEIIKRSDDELVEIARSSFVKLLGVKPDAKPLFARVFRWVGGMPQYTMGHLDRVEELEARCDGHRRASRSPAARTAAWACPTAWSAARRPRRKVLGEWGIALDEDAAEQKRLY